MARQWWGWALLRRAGASERDWARELLGQAIEIYEEMKIPRHTHDARSLLTGTR